MPRQIGRRLVFLALAALALGTAVYLLDRDWQSARFLEWLGTDGQSILVDSNHEFPANINAEAEPLITEEFGTEFIRQDISAKEMGELNPRAVELMDEANFG